MRIGSSFLYETEIKWEEAGLYEVGITVTSLISPCGSAENRFVLELM